MAELHFLRPGWLLALPIGVGLILYLFRLQGRGGAWRNVVDRALQPFVLTASDGYSGRRWPLAVALAAWTVATVALAGPAWERLPVPAFRSNDALVVALDLSRSMDAADLAPSRLARAKLKLLSLLDRRVSGQTALVVFSSHAFTVTPLTTDTQTIASLVAALSTDIMPTRGSRIGAGLETSAELIRRAGLTRGRILLMTDAEPTAADLRSAAALRDAGIDIDVLAIGTEEGAPIPERDGGFVTDARGNVVVPKVDTAALARLAEAGGGRFSVITADDSDLMRLESPDSGGVLDEGGDDVHVADTWRDAGAWLAVLLLPLIALGFRRGWIAVIAGFLLALPPHADAQPVAESEPPAASADDGGLADLWWSLWRRPDQRAAAAFERGAPQRAAELFEDPEWRAAAQYRAGDYEASAATLAGLDTATAHYNRGNALARAGELRAAIAAYDRALELDPDHEDARYNRDLLEKLLEQQRQHPQQSVGQEQAPGQQQSPQDPPGEPGNEPDPESRLAESGESSVEAGERDAGEPGQRQADGTPGGASSAEDDSSGERLADATPSPGEGEGVDGEPQETESESATEPRLADGSNAVPVDAEELERWASDQAAEQWLRRVRQDPGGLLRRKFLYQYQRLGIDQQGNDLHSAQESEPW